MDNETQLKVQAFLDGELPEQEAREIASLVARDAEATDLMAELRNTRKALAGFEAGVRVPETREFYWSKIERRLEQLERVPAEPESASLFMLLRRLLLPASALAALAVALVIVGRSGSPAGQDGAMTMADSGAFTYHDYANGTTLVWLSYPAER